MGKLIALPDKYGGLESGQSTNPIFTLIERSKCSNLRLQVQGANIVQIPIHGCVPSTIIALLGNKLKYKQIIQLN